MLVVNAVGDGVLTRCRDFFDAATVIPAMTPTGTRESGGRELVFDG